MSEYKRLTKRVRSHILVESQTDANNRLAELEDKIENGMLVELPCKVGDKVWFIKAYEEVVVEAVVTRICFNGEIYFEVESEYCDYIVFAKGCFLTKVEVEKKLKELNGGDNNEL